MSTKKIAAVAGMACAGVAVGVAQLVAAAVDAASAPVVSVGAVVIDLTPEPVKAFAISMFGVYDKLALVAGIAVLLLVFAATIGILARRRIWMGYLGLLVFGTLGAVTAVVRPGADLLWALPATIGTGCAAVALWLIYRPNPDTDDSSISMLVNRRRVLFAMGAAGVAGAAGWRLSGTDSVETARAAIRLPQPKSTGASAAKNALDVTGLTPYITDTANNGFYRVDTALTIPRVNPSDYRLSITGRVASELQLSYQDLLDRDLVEREITLSCVSNQVGDRLAGNARWLGVPLTDLLAEVRPDKGADQLVSRSADGWTCGTPTRVCRDGRDAMLAVGMNGEPLPLRHGFPVRMLVPGLYGYVSATKWLVELELSSFDDFDPYWVRKGWDPEAPIKTFSRIDTPTASKRPRAGTVPVAGVAWAQQRGIGAVEVRADEGEWHEAELAEVISTDTWRQWVWEWDAEPGRHKLEVRATDQTGSTQTEKRVNPFPNGATGWHSVVVTVE